jgi:ketosteroid isomerase-like protein
MEDAGRRMKRDIALDLVETYIESWKAQALERFLHGLCEDVVVEECDGAVHQGIDEARCWFIEWHEAPIRGRVTEWRVSRFLFDEKRDIATLEWAFACDCHGRASSFRGASVITFREDKIHRIAEYRMDTC